MGNNIKFSFRVGRVEDCPSIAHRVNHSAQGAVDYLYQGISTNRSPIELLSDQMATEVHYSFANTMVAETAGHIVAIALSFPASGLAVNETMLTALTPEKLHYLKYFCDNSIKDSWHLDAIYVDQEFRQLGLGDQLLSRVKQQAEYYHYPFLQAFVFANNEGATRFYQSRGFEVDLQIVVDTHEFLKDKKRLLRMRCKLGANH